MKLALSALVVLGAAAVAAPAQAQLPPGSYQRQCRDISVNGQFLSARCPSAQGGWANSSINVLSCRGGIDVDREGGLICGGPGPGQGPGPGPGPYPPPGGGRPPAGADRFSITIFDRPGYRGRAMTVDGDMPNLDRTGFNDRVASIRFGRRSGPWLVCEDSAFRGRCVTVRGDTRNLGQLGMLNTISSLRPLR